MPEGCGADQQHHACGARARAADQLGHGKSFRRRSQGALGDESRSSAAWCALENGGEARARSRVWPQEDQREGNGPWLIRPSRSSFPWPSGSQGSCPLKNPAGRPKGKMAGRRALRGPQPASASTSVIGGDMLPTAMRAKKNEAPQISPSPRMSVAQVAADIDGARARGSGASRHGRLVLRSDGGGGHCHDRGGGRHPKSRSRPASGSIGSGSRPVSWGTLGRIITPGM